MTMVTHFTEDDWERTSATWRAWWAGDLERPLVLIEVIDPALGTAKLLPGFANDEWDNLAVLPPELPVEMVIDVVQKRLEATHWLGDAFPKWWPNFGPGIIAGFLGARAEAVEETTWYHPLPANSLSDIHPAYDEENEWWRRLRAITAAAASRWSGQLTFGHFDMIGCLDILATLRGTSELLLDTLRDPEQILRLVDQLTSLWLRYFREYHDLVSPHTRGYSCWGPIWFPGRGYYLQCDFAYMISPEMFERFVMPELSVCCDALDYAFYHLDGKGQIRHLEMLLSLPRLRGIQWMPGAGQPQAQEWLPLLSRIRDSGKRCQVFVTRQGARRILRELGGKGFILKIDETLTLQEADAFLRSLAEEGIDVPVPRL